MRVKIHRAIFFQFFFQQHRLIRSTHFVGLGRLVEHASVDGSGHQVVGGRDGVNVPGEMEVELK